MKQVDYGRDARRFLRRHHDMAERLREAIQEFIADRQVHGNNVTRLKGSSAFRIRVGAYRIIFEETETKVVVTKIDTRSDAYKDKT